MGRLIGMLVMVVFVGDLSNGGGPESVNKEICQ